jgi:hypothetical protein
MNGGFKDVILEEVYDELCDRYQYAAGCTPKTPQQAQPKQARPKTAPTPKAQVTPQQKQQRKQAGKESAKKAKASPCPSHAEAEYSFKTCARKDGTTYGIPNKSSCKKGDEVKDKALKKTKKEATEASIDSLKNLVTGDLEGVRKSLEKTTKARAKLQKLDPVVPPAKAPAKAVAKFLVKSLGFAEEYDFKGAGTGKPCGSSHISASYECRLDAGERKELTDGLIAKGGSKEKIDKLSDEQISRVSQLVKDKGLNPDEGERVSRGVEKLKEQSGGKKEGGANLQDPAEAKKYSQFYEQKKDLTYKAPYDTDPKVVKATLERLKEEDPESYSKTISALNGKGSPTKEQLAEAGWKSSSERGEAVLKSLMDNDFKDVMGQDLSWRQGLQLDHKQAGSTGGTDTPSNWIWISTATNQAKGGMEAAARKKGGSPAEKEEYIRQGLIGKLNKNAEMSKQDVAKAKGAGSAKALAKSQEAAALRDNLPLMTPAQRGERISNAGGKEMESVLKASVAAGKNPETGRKTSYRPVLSGGNGERVRKAYGTVPQMKAIARMRWDEKLSDSDLRNIGGVLKASTGSTKSRSDLLNEMLGNFPRTSGLTAAERIAILDAAE